ncbi:MAG: hypothetical protein ACKVXR_10320 [Planctomycetota bacterium]
MNRGSWIFLVGAVALAGAVAAMATREHARSPEEDLRDIHERLGRGKLDRDDALSGLDRLVERTLETGDPAFVAKLRISRGRLLMDIAAWDRAREDLQVALGLGVLSDLERDEAEDDLIALHLRAGAHENALNLVKTLLDRDPGDASAWMRSGEIHRQKAEIQLVDARELIASRLVADEALQAEAELDRLAAMDPIDPKRPAASHALAARFEIGDEDRASRILRMALAAARENSQARMAFATSIAVKDPRADPGRALAALIELLDRAGRSGDAAEVGTCGLRMLRSRGDTNGIGLLVDVLEKLGRKGYACEVGKRLVAMPNPIPPSRLLKLTRLFYANGRWADLGVAASKLMQVGTTAEMQEAGYYAAMSQVHQEQYATGLYALQRFLATPATQPVEGARAEAWKMVAIAARKLRLSDLEREALDTSIQLDKDGSGEQMLRLAAILAASAQGGFRRPEMQVAQAMNLMPERTAELFPLWERYGKKELEETHRSTTDVLTNDAWSPVFAGASNASAFELYTLARVLLYKGQAARAEFYVRRLNILLPNFVPGIDLWIRTMQKLHRMKELEDALLLRMSLAGVDATTRAALATVPTRKLPLDRRITFMAADPEGFGRREVARGFLARGRPDLALELVGKRVVEPAPEAEGVEDDPNDLPEAREVAAAALLDLGRPQEAFQTLDPLGARATSNTEALELYTRAALHSGRRKALEIATKRVARSLLPRRAAWLRLGELMLSHGAAEAALPLVRRLDSSPGTRGGEVLLALAWVQLHLGLRDGLALTLERADAFETGGQAEIIGLLAAVENADPSSLSAVIARLKSSGWKPNRLQRAALLLIEGDREAARTLIDAGLAERAGDLDWLLADSLERSMRGAAFVLPDTLGAEAEAETARFLQGEKRIDPKLCASLLLVANDPPAAGWLEAKFRARMAADTEARAGLWEHWLMARFSRARGEIAIEGQRLEALLARHGGFEPAWDRLEQIAASSRMQGVDLLSIHERRLHGLGLRAGSEAERVFTIARIQHRDGDLEGALASLARVAEIEPGHKGVSIEVGRIRAKRGEWAEAVRAFVAASEAESSAADLASTGELIEALDRAGQVVPPPLTVHERMGVLEALSKRVPDDSRVPVALARMDLEQDPGNPALGVARGQARLQKFLGTHKDTNLEDLGTGASSAWTDYLLELDPDRARRMLERDRERNPRGIEPWIQLGRIRAARPRAIEQDKRKMDGREMDELETVRRMAPTARVLDAYARVRLAGSPRLQEIMLIARDVPASMGRTEPDPDLALRLARAYFGIGPNGLMPALKLLNKLAWTKDLPPDIALEAELLRAEALVTRGEAARAARILGEVSTRIMDPYRATVAQTTASLADRVSQQ